MAGFAVIPFSIFIVLFLLIQLLENVPITYASGFKKCDWLSLKLSGLCIWVQPELCIFLAPVCVIHWCSFSNLTSRVRDHIESQ